MNSLQELSNELGSKLAEIRLSIGHPANRDKVFILLEGKTDIRLFRNIFSHQYTDTTALNGKEKLIEALDILGEEGYSKIIALKDADFDHLDNVAYPHNLFITDYADMEVQMIESEALKSVICEFGSEECYSNLLENLRNQIYALAIEIGYIRWYSSREGGLFNFKKINLNSLVGYNNCQVSLDLDTLIGELYLQIDKDNANIEENSTLLKEVSYDRLQICNGHDLTTLIANYFTAGNINQKKVEGALRLSYTMEYFQITNLYVSLQNWANTNNHRLFD
ncbi:MAG: DUF4435 domain-containing protein [Campylobacterota bacterium]|nr:DUF4435 domain-containing protein [Campylobacterota bacterium]